MDKDSLRATIIDGKAIAEKIRQDMAVQISTLLKDNHKPHLAVVLVGENPASLVYIRHKEKACQDVGMGFSLVKMPQDSTLSQVVSMVQKLNNDPQVTGILVQQPLPAHIDPHPVVLAVDPKKDVDCLHPSNLGLLAVGKGVVAPCTPQGVITLLKSVAPDLKGKHAVIVGRSHIVGKPMAHMLLQEDATVTICHSHTKNLQEICRQGDILVAAVGQPQLITGDFIKTGAIVVDVGINRSANGRLCGDVDFNQALLKAAHITPVPGGVGPMTIATLIANCVAMCKNQKGC